MGSGLYVTSCCLRRGSDCNANFLLIDNGLTNNNDLKFSRANFGQTTPWSILRQEMLLQYEAYAHKQVLLIRQLEQMRQNSSINPVDSHTAFQYIGQGSLQRFPASDHAIDNFVNVAKNGIHVGSHVEILPPEPRAQSTSGLEGPRRARELPSRCSSCASSSHSIRVAESAWSNVD